MASKLQHLITLSTFSLLLGVDEEKRQLACGLVDTIGELHFELSSFRSLE